ncbi:MAG: hypothetical protein WBD22_08915 [Pyrinomonadaceae bacterium]
MKFNGINRKFSCAILVIALVTFLGSDTSTQAQEIVDKSVATVRDGLRSKLITYSDLLWQLALQPNTPIDPPSSEDLDRALQILIDQRLFSLEADRVPRQPPTDIEIADEIAKLLKHFSVGDFERRLRLVGFSSVRDPNFKDIIKQRLSIEKYLDFRFESFIVITPEDEARYYRDVFVPEFRRENPGHLMPTLDAERANINRILIEQRVADGIERFLDQAKQRAEVVILNDVWPGRAN